MNKYVLAGVLVVAGLVFGFLNVTTPIGPLFLVLAVAAAIAAGVVLTPHAAAGDRATDPATDPAA